MKHPIVSKSINDEPLLFALQLGPSPSIEQDEIWLLLSKHTDVGIENEYISLQVREDIPSGSATVHPVDLAVRDVFWPSKSPVAKKFHFVYRLNILIAHTYWSNFGQRGRKHGSTYP